MHRTNELVSSQDLILRSRARHGVSKDGDARCGLWLSFEARAKKRAPRDEVLMGIHAL
jgi:hypothetical protein